MGYEVIPSFSTLRVSVMPVPRPLAASLFFYLLHINPGFLLRSNVFEPTKFSLTLQSLLARSTSLGARRFRRGSRLSGEWGHSASEPPLRLPS